MVNRQLAFALIDRRINQMQVTQIVSNKDLISLNGIL